VCQVPPPPWKFTLKLWVPPMKWFCTIMVRHRQTPRKEKRKQRAAGARRIEKELLHVVEERTPSPHQTPPYRQHRHECTSSQKNHVQPADQNRRSPTMTKCLIAGCGQGNPTYNKKKKLAIHLTDDHKLTRDIPSGGPNRRTIQIGNTQMHALCVQHSLYVRPKSFDRLSHTKRFA